MLEVCCVDCFVRNASLGGMNLQPTSAEQPASFIKPKPSEARYQLDRICLSKTFANSPQLREILSFLVEHDLTNAANDLTAKCIRENVLDGIYPSDESDPTATVRVQVGRLRRMLDAYYMNEGKDAPIRLTIAHRTYRPTIAVLIQLWNNPCPTTNATGLMLRRNLRSIGG
jgi:hypothetical protein